MRTYTIKIKGTAIRDALGRGGKGQVRISAIDRESALAKAVHRFASGSVELGGVHCDDIQILGIAVAGRR